MENPLFVSIEDTSTIPAWCCKLEEHNCSRYEAKSFWSHFLFLSKSVNCGVVGTQRSPTLLSSGFVPGLHGDMASMEVVSDVDVGDVYRKQFEMDMCVYWFVTNACSWLNGSTWKKKEVVENNILNRVSKI